MLYDSYAIVAIDKNRLHEPTVTNKHNWGMGHHPVALNKASVLMEVEDLMAVSFIMLQAAILPIAGRDGYLEHYHLVMTNIAMENPL